MTQREPASNDRPAPLGDPKRRDALRRFDPPDGSLRPVFDRLARVASAMLKAPMALISLIDADRQLLKGAVGLPPALDRQQEFPLDYSFCKDVVLAGEPLNIRDARADPLRRHSPAIEKLGLAAYVGVPLATDTGAIIGVLAVGAHVPRKWTANDVEQLCDLAGVVMAELDLRREARERLRAVEERDAEIAQLKEALQSSERFLSIAAHELRTPLTSMLGCAQLLHRHLDSQGLPERDRRLLEGMTQDVYRLDRMLEGLLDVARIQSGRLRLSREPLDLVALVWSVISSIKTSAARERIVVSSPLRPVMVLADVQRLGQVLNHLLHNALAYSPAGGPVEVKVELRGDMATVAVSDRGIGIPQSALAQLFSPFYRAPNVRALRASGLGVGLFLVKELMALHDGRVEVTSEEYEGSTFRIFLPIHQVSDKEEEHRGRS